MTSGEEVGVCCHGTLASLALAQLTSRDVPVALFLCFRTALRMQRDFRTQQCSAYNDVQYQGRYYEWLPQYHFDPATSFGGSGVGPGTKLGGGAGTQSPGWDTVHC